MVKKLLVGLLTACMCVLPVMADNEVNDKTGVFFKIEKDRHIDIDSSDVFEFKVSKNSSGTKEELLASCETISVSVKENKHVDVYPLDPGVYYVYEAKYLGDNKDIISDGYAYSNIFEVSDDPESIYSVDLSIGKMQVDILCKTYDSVSVIRNNQYLSALEALNNTKQSTTHDGTVPEINDSGDTDVDTDKKDTDEETSDKNESPTLIDEKEESKESNKKESPLVKFLYGTFTVSIFVGIATFIYIRKKK